jgi:hypothetical protein
MGIRDKPIAPGSPWQNAFAERLIGSIRRECVDHMVVLGEAHLRRVLKSYAQYYNGSRIHRSLSKDTPFPRAIERLGVITSQPVLGGLHHQYCFGTHNPAGLRRKRTIPRLFYSFNFLSYLGHWLVLRGVGRQPILHLTRKSKDSVELFTEDRECCGDSIFKNETRSIHVRTQSKSSKPRSTL